jgi:hypothetical protein
VRVRCCAQLGDKVVRELGGNNAVGGSVSRSVGGCGGAHRTSRKGKSAPYVVANVKIVAFGRKARIRGRPALQLVKTNYTANHAPQALIG